MSNRDKQVTVFLIGYFYIIKKQMVFGITQSSFSRRIMEAQITLVDITGHFEVKKGHFGKVV